MSKEMIILYITVIWFCACGSGALSLPRRASTRNMEVMPFYSGTSFDYDYGVEPKKSNSLGSMQLQRTSQTTRRPFIKYWRNLLRNVRLSMPTITWNMTNPFSNMFNDGEPNYIETPINQDYDEYTTNVQKRKRKSQRRKSSKRDKRRRTKPTNYDNIGNINEGQEQPDANNDDNTSDYYKEQEAQMPQYLLRPYDSDSIKKPVLLYDPRTDQYYEVQSIRNPVSPSPLQNSEGTTSDFSIKKPVVTTEQDEFIEIVGTKASDMVDNDEKMLSVDLNSVDHNTKLVVITTEKPESENVEGSVRNTQAFSNINDSPQIATKSLNNDLIATTKENSRKAHGWKTFLYYFIPQYI